MSANFATRAALVGLMLGLGACASGGGGPDLFSPKPQPTARFPDIPYADWSDAEPAYRLYPGDELDVQVPSAPELSKTVTVQPDGRVALPLLPPIMVAQRTVGDAERILSRAYASQLLRPDVQIIAKAQPLKVFVGGEVDKPGVYDMPGDINALQAVILAGGFKTSAKRGQVVIIRRTSDGRAMMRTADLRGGISAPGQTDLVPLRRFDIVYVPRTSVTEAGLFVQQYFRDLAPVQLGVDYSAGSTFVAGSVVK
jgi:protein involved in polysaccharide export with SLBB domain